MIVREFKYRTKTNYAELWGLAQRESVICILDTSYAYSEGASQDIARTLWNGQLMAVGARGIGYINAETPEEFAAQAAAVSLEWLDPCGPLGVPESDGEGGFIIRAELDIMGGQSPQERERFFALWDLYTDHVLDKRARSLQDK